MNESIYAADRGYGAAAPEIEIFGADKYLAEPYNHWLLCFFKEG